MNDAYWKEFYKTKHILTPSPFAKFVQELYADKTFNILDMGCGNGRDSYYFAKHKHKVTGVDKFNLPKSSKKNLTFIEGGIPKKITADMVYSRFFLHAVTDAKIYELMDKTPKIFVAEYRLLGDNPEIYKYHKRNFLAQSGMLGMLNRNGFKILHEKSGYDMAVYENENPLVGRVVATR